MIAVRLDKLFRKLFRMGLGLLEADDIRGFLLEPLQKTFFFNGTDAIDVPA
jgi:hypothetical protein